MNEHAMPGVWGLDASAFDDLRAEWDRRPRASMDDDLAPGVKGRRFPPPTYAISDDGEARIFVRGLLLSDAAGWRELSYKHEGSVRYEDLLATVRAAVRDPLVQRIVLDWNCRGGEITGAFEAGEEIRALAGGPKSIESYARGFCTSCAYWLASATRQIVASPTAVLGSIGVMVDTVDRTTMDASVGIQRKTYVSRVSPRKDHRTPEAAADTQSMVDEMARVFVDAVARNRSVTAEHVATQMGQGGGLLGQAALDARLCDAIAAAAPVSLDAPDPDPAILTPSDDEAEGRGTTRPGAARAIQEKHMEDTRAAEPTAAAQELEQLRADNEKLRATLAAKEDAQASFRSQLEGLQKRADERTKAEYVAARDAHITALVAEGRYLPADAEGLRAHADKMSGAASGVVGPEALADFKAISSLAPKGGARPVARTGATGTGSVANIHPFLAAAKAARDAGTDYTAELDKLGVAGEA
jgi:ClpP class serine protease